MNVKQLIVVRILFLVARMFAEEAWAQEIKDLGTHIQVHAGVR